MESHSVGGNLLPSGTTKLIRFLAAQTCFTTALLTPASFRDPLLQNFALLPSATLAQSKIWNVLTASYLESHPARSLINTVLLLFISRYSFAPWSARQLFGYVSIVNFAAACFTCIAMLAAYVVTRAGTYIFTPIATTSGLCAALLVAFRHLNPEFAIGVGSINVSATYLPICYVTVLIGLALLQLSSIGVVCFAVFATHVAWFYLRFLKKREDGSFGDSSDSFAYPAFFPYPIRAIMVPIAGITYLIWSPALGRWQNAGEGEILPVVEPSTTKMSDRDAERRRQRALLALEEKLKADAARDIDTSEQSNVA